MDLRTELDAIVNSVDEIAELVGADGEGCAPLTSLDTPNGTVAIGSGAHTGKTRKTRKTQNRTANT